MLKKYNEEYLIDFFYLYKTFKNLRIKVKIFLFIIPLFFLVIGYFISIKIPQKFEITYIINRPAEYYFSDIIKKIASRQLKSLSGVNVFLNSCLLEYNSFNQNISNTIQKDFELKNISINENLFEFNFFYYNENINKNKLITYVKDKLDSCTIDMMNNLKRVTISDLEILRYEYKYFKYLSEQNISLDKSVKVEYNFTLSNILFKIELLNLELNSFQKIKKYQDIYFIEKDLMGKFLTSKGFSNIKIFALSSFLLGISLSFLLLFYLGLKKK